VPIVEGATATAFAVATLWAVVWLDADVLCVCLTSRSQVCAVILWAAEYVGEVCLSLFGGVLHLSSMDL
jgi:hypothetical protein